MRVRDKEDHKESDQFEDDEIDEDPDEPCDPLDAHQVFRLSEQISGRNQVEETPRFGEFSS